MKAPDFHITNLLDFYHLHKKKLFLVLVIIINLILIFPNMDYQGMLSSYGINGFLAQGDHGHDLYCYQQTLKGKVPYRDYWWVYGPLMPYYYSFFFFLLGINIKSILIGKAILFFFSSILCFLILSVFISLPFALLGSIWFTTFYPDFFHTYSHTGGVTATLLVIYYLALYIKIPKLKYQLIALVSAFILCLIKINMGITSLILILLISFLTNRIKENVIPAKNKKVYTIAILVFFAGIALIHFVLLYGLPFHIIRQCFPYISADHPMNSSVFRSLFFFIKNTVFSLHKKLCNYLLFFFNNFIDSSSNGELNKA